MTVPAVLTAGRADRVRVSAMLARAFADDPAFSFIFPDPKVRQARLPRLFALLFDSDGRAGLRLTTRDGEAATMWRGPGQARTGWGEVLAHAVPLIRALGGSSGRAWQVADAIDAHMPAGDFWYLHVAGCEPARQRQGLGFAVVESGLSRIGAALPVYLETATERNVRFYQKLGFVVTSEWALPRDGPRFWSMTRKAAL